MLDDLAATDGDRLPNPRVNEWGWGDIAVGWVVAHLALVTVGFGLGMLAATEEPLVRGAFHAVAATVWGTLVISLFGVPFGAWLATRLRPVRSGLVHLAAFAGLGAVGCLIHSAIMFPGPGSSYLSLEFLAWFGWMCAHGVPAAVAARFAAKCWAIVMHDLRTDARTPSAQAA